MGYDDSSWATYTGGWVPGDGSRSPMYLRNEFTIGTPSAGNFSIVVDDDFIVWVNGILVPALNDQSGGCCTYGSADITSFLQAGTNVIAVKADNTPGGGYYISFSGSVTAADPVAAVPEPSSLSLMGLALAGLITMRRKKV